MAETTSDTARTGAPSASIKALSLTQPWATLVALNEKRIETRSWSTNYRGRIAIHAAKGFPKYAQDLCIEEPFSSTLGMLSGNDWKFLPRGGVIALARLVNCVPTGPSASFDQLLDQWGGVHEYSFGDYSPGRWAWLLADIVPLEEPIPARGALGLWDWTPTPAGGTRMGWSFTVGVVPKDQFAAAVDAAQATGQPPESIGLAEDVAAAKDALKSLAGRVKRAKVGGSANGHCLQPTDGNNYSDSVSASVYGAE